MQTWALSPPLKPPPGDVGYALGDTLSGVTDAIGEHDFAARALSLVNAALAVDFMSVYRVYGDQPPRMFLSASRSARDVSLDCFRRYQRGLYRRDQTFAGARKLAAGGVPAMTLWNEAEIPSPHRDQIYRRHGIHERLSVVAADDRDGMLAINLYRYDVTGRFRDGEIDAAQAIGRPFLSCVNKHLQIVTLLREAARTAASGVRQLLLECCSSLTPRELDVCERLALGWTYDGIAQDLGLTVPSVKTYRARAFDRLGIHFRNELFALIVSGGVTR